MRWLPRAWIVACDLSPDSRKANIHGLLYFTPSTRDGKEILSAVPSSRLLVLKTNAIASSAGRIGALVGVPPETLKVSRSHSFARDIKPIKVSELIERDYSADKIEFYCGDLVRELFAEQP